ncbi:DMT family transporter [Sulfoacidibacillus thermotolerans]|uniref:EamA family transporter n=1 Tax=Sulfoacidibacillus thermotolerans TaxID=1765684 RepID=A0A2U3D787_SULT2|nr:EamA family transporter [Sulfoacidibacillus thermotolerans]PWI57137.1 EamA family transporter [Sulfoacidibacillus thermotolerans]
MNRLFYTVLVIATTALMGSSFAVGKIDMEYISPLLLVGIRFTLAGLVMAFLVLRRQLPHTLGDWVHIFMIGLFQTTGVMASIFISMRTISAGESAILTFSNPLFVILFGTLFLRIHYRLIQWTGVLAGFIGVFITLGMQLHVHSGTWIGLAGAISWAIATLLIKRWNARFDLWVLTAYQMLFGGIVLLIFSLTLEHTHLVLNFVSVSALLWLAIMGSIVQFAIWFYLLQKNDPAKTSAFLFLAPFFGILSGWLLLAEPISWFVALGSLLIFIGIFLVNWPQASD